MKRTKITDFFSPKRDAVSLLKKNKVIRDYGQSSQEEDGKAKSHSTQTKVTYIEPEKISVPSNKKISAPNAKSTSKIRTDLPDEQLIPLWLREEYIKDAVGHRPNDPDYNPKTVYIPPNEWSNFTKVQVQYWMIKRENYDAVVLIQKGKFYEMFNWDALWGRDMLKLRLTFNKREVSCGIPFQAFNEWTMKIVNFGRRVCKVDQAETAIDQKQKGLSKTIERDLVQSYSIGTIDDFEMLESAQPSYLMAIRSTDRDCAGVVLVDCSVGSFHLGVLKEEELRDCLVRFSPVEVLYFPGLVYPEHINLIKEICGSVLTRSNGKNTDWDPELCTRTIELIGGWESLPSSLEGFPKEAMAALGGCVSYLEYHKIGGSLLKMKNFNRIEETGSEKFMFLDASGLTNLQIVGDKSLLSELDRCSTPFGKRALRFHLLHPLLSIERIKERQECIGELMDPKYGWLKDELSKIPDLERMLYRVYSGKSSLKVFLNCLEGFDKIGKIVGDLEQEFNSAGLKHLFPDGLGARIQESVGKTRCKIKINESLQENQLVVRSGVFDELDRIDIEIDGVMSRLQDELQRVSDLLGYPDLKYSHTQSERYVFEIPQEYSDNLDSSFQFVSDTKHINRYRTIDTSQLLEELEAKENTRLHLREDCQKRVVTGFSEDQELWNRVVESLGELDFLRALGEACQSWGGWCVPQFEKGGHGVMQIKGMRHPLLGDRAIANDIDFSECPVMILTGPNASGKSTFARTCCVAIILAQIGCYLPASSARMTIFDGVYTRIGAGDRLFSGLSTFGVELTETAKLMRLSTERSFVVLDELGRGTSTIDGIAIATAVLEFFIKEKKCPLVFCTHYHVLAEEFGEDRMVRNCSMAYESDLTLLYRLVDHPCPSSFGCEVARKCGIPDEITAEAQNIANDFEARHEYLHHVQRDRS